MHDPATTSDDALTDLAPPPGAPSDAAAAADSPPAPRDAPEDAPGNEPGDVRGNDDANPRVWVLISDKRGDDGQSQIIARSLGWPCEIKQMRFTARAQDLRQTPCLASTAGLDPACLDLLTPPWPDLVISAGWQQEPVARWLKQQSGGRTRLVQLNRPYGLEDFDLVVVPPQHAVPPRDNVFRLSLPLHRKDDPAALAEAAETWKARFHGRPRPWIAVMVGGPTAPLQMDDATVDRMMAECRAASERLGGSLFITTSPRTPASAVPRIEAGLRPNDFLYRWAPGQQDNPYLALLALCDRFVVTADSVSMVCEILHLGKALTIYPLPQRLSTTKRLKRLSQQLVHGLWPGAAQLGPLHRRLSDWANRRLQLRYHRDLDFFRRWVVSQGWASERIEAEPKPISVPDDLALLSRRIHALFPDAR